MVDLTAFVPEANKIRTNKNYHPDRGETNRFILYSDAVHSVPDIIFHELLEGKPENAADLAAAAVTPTFYIQDEETVYGPVSRTEPTQPEVAAPMEALFCAMDCPDGKSHSFLCVRAEYDARPRQEPVLRMIRKPAPVAAPAVQPAAVPVAQVTAPVNETEPAAETAAPAETRPA